MDLTEKKLADGKKSGAQYLCTACPYCQMQFDTVQERIRAGRGSEHQLPAILYTQLLGLSMEIKKELLGLEMNRVSLEEVEQFFLDKEEQKAA